jgi:hypothetical protein
LIKSFLYEMVVTNVLKIGEPYLNNNIELRVDLIFDREKYILNIIIKLRIEFILGREMRTCIIIYF